MSDKLRGRGQHSNLWGFEFPSKSRGGSYDLCRVLDKLFHKGKLGEGRLAGMLGWHIWREEWKAMVQYLIDQTLIAEDHTGHGNSRQLFLSDNGKEWAEDFYGFASVHEQARAEILEAGQVEAAR